MSNAKKKTGLGAGVGAFFQTDDDTAATEPGKTRAPEPSKPEKVRTTVMLYPTTLSGIELLKSESRKRGNRATMSDILNDAVAMLMRERNIKLP